MGQDEPITYDSAAQENYRHVKLHTIEDAGHNNIDSFPIYHEGGEICFVLFP